ncbi:putative nucleic acid-binding Zn-ribbon protein [Methanohalophilus levihalophilus]|uniref:hypothetical protein n=1 Tax=Methanohalophilus levihalophilus TaxID=1431282 RepID=UPI001AE9EEF8|nr:hypothetical protein [Methanohalophilus levihalophilus]MBP2030792.1 putative nucleic acid-binding Zn-ribbon protein [Methanohalophilus levihalophilus]
MKEKQMIMDCFHTKKLELEIKKTVNDARYFYVKKANAHVNECKEVAKLYNDNVSKLKIKEYDIIKQLESAKENLDHVIRIAELKDENIEPIEVDENVSIEDVEVGIIELAKQIKTIEHNIRKLENKSVSFNPEIRSEIGRYKKVIELKSKELDLLHRQKAILNPESSSIQKRIKELTNEVGSLERKLKRIQGKIRKQIRIIKEENDSTDIDHLLSQIPFTIVTMKRCNLPEQLEDEEIYQLMKGARDNLVNILMKQNPNIRLFNIPINYNKDYSYMHIIAFQQFTPEEWQAISEMWEKPKECSFDIRCYNPGKGAELNILDSFEFAAITNVRI